MKTQEQPQELETETGVCWCGYVDCDGKHSQYHVARILQKWIERVEANERATQAETTKAAM